MKYISVKIVRSLALLAMIALSAVQSSVRTFFHNTILFIDTYNNEQYKLPHSLLGTQHLTIISSNRPSRSFTTKFSSLLRYLLI